MASSAVSASEFSCATGQQIDELFSRSQAFCESFQATSDVLITTALPQPEEVAAVASYRATKSDKFETGSIVDDSLSGGSTRGKSSDSAAGSLSGNEVDHETKSREDISREEVVASVMQLVEDRLQLLEDSFWRMKGDLLETEIKVKAQVEASHELLNQRLSQISKAFEADRKEADRQLEASHELLEQQLSQLAMAQEADRQMQQELSKEVQAVLREPAQNREVLGLYCPVSPKKLATVTEQSVDAVRSSDLALCNASEEQSVHEWVQNAMAKHGPLERSCPAIITTEHSSGAGERSCAQPMPTGDAFPPLSVLQDALEAALGGYNDCSTTVAMKSNVHAEAMESRQTQAVRELLNLKAEVCDADKASGATWGANVVRALSATLVTAPEADSSWSRKMEEPQTAGSLQGQPTWADAPNSRYASLPGAGFADQPAVMNCGKPGSWSG